MNKFIYKYKPIPLDYENLPFCGYISIPMNSTILSGAIIDGDIFIYAFVDPTETAMTRVQIAILPTGDSLTKEDFEILYDKNTKFLGTFVDESRTKSENPLVWHVWTRET